MHRNIALDTGGNAWHCYPDIPSIDSFFAVHDGIDNAVWALLSCGADRMQIYVDVHVYGCTCM